MTLKRFFIILLIFQLSINGIVAQQLLSPDKNMALTFSLNENGIPAYQVFFKNALVIKNSKLGFILKNDENNLFDNFAISNTETSTFDETWQPVWGEESQIRNHYNEMAVTLNHQESNRQMIIRFRVFNDGVGFRYEFPEQDNLGHFVIEDEKTQFAMTGNHTAFWIP